MCIFFLSLGQQSRRYYSTLRNIRFPWYSATRPNFLVVFFPICSLTDSRPADTELRLKHILLEASGQIHLHKDVAQVSFVSFGEISHFFNLWWCQALSRKTRERERRESSSGLWSRIDIHDPLLLYTTTPTDDYTHQSIWFISTATHFSPLCRTWSRWIIHRKALALLLFLSLLLSFSWFHDLPQLWQGLEIH